ncbi:hypothetical protein ACIRQY_30625 [Streptomyces sp. NPDC101490]|uniref:hypothetical protein n=1 Tax=Streptomyces sp. NPDC101490 TaxID=3366143 RepID=UPI003828D6DD
MPDHDEPPRAARTEETRTPGAAGGLPRALRVAGLVLSRTPSPPDLACWTGSRPEPTGGGSAVVSVVTEPAAPPDEATLRLAHDVVDRFDALIAEARRYCRTRLREERFGLTAEEVGLLDLPDLPLAGPEATVWADGSWAVLFTESRFRLGDPYGILVTFDGASPVDVEGVDDAE